MLCLETLHCVLWQTLYLTFSWFMPGVMAGLEACRTFTETEPGCICLHGQSASSSHGIQGCSSSFKTPIFRFSLFVSNPHYCHCQGGSVFICLCDGLLTKSIKIQNRFHLNLVEGWGYKPSIFARLKCVFLTAVWHWNVLETLWSWVNSVRWRMSLVAADGAQTVGLV